MALLSLHHVSVVQRDIIVDERISLFVKMDDLCPLPK